jgi:hypothetical protein
MGFEICTENVGLTEGLTSQNAEFKCLIGIEKKYSCLPPEF